MYQLYFSKIELMCITRLAILGYWFKMYNEVNEMIKMINKQVNIGLYVPFIYNNISIALKSVLIR